jgi:uncharacterized protein (DUF58 family)
MGRLWWLLAGSVALISVLMRHNLLFLMSLLLALVGLVSMMWARWCLAEVTYTRHVANPRIFCGEETQLAVEITNAKPLPLAWLRAEDRMPNALEMQGVTLSPSHQPGRKRLINLLSLRWYERVTRTYRLRAIHRGVWQIGPAEIVSGDIFGFGIQRDEFPHMHSVVVYPRVVPITALGLPALRPFGDYSTPHRLITDPLRLMSTRAYAPGDSFRHIHWKATARRRALQTKVFEPSASQPIAVFLNVNTFNRLYEGRDPELQEYAISATASVARWAADAGRPVGVFANTIVQPEGARVNFKPSARPDQLERILDALARVVTQFGRWPIESILGIQGRQLAYGSTIVVVTAALNPLLEQQLTALARRHYSVGLITLGRGRLEKALPGVRHYHIGGTEEWRELQTLALA